MTNYVCNEPQILWDDELAIQNVLNSKYLAQGFATVELENKMADIHNKKYGIAFSNATAALESIFEVTLVPGDEVVICPYTWKGVIHAIIRAGGVPVFVDAGNDYLGDWSKIPVENPKMIVVTHLFGLPDRNIDRLKRDYPDALIVEDCAQAIGAKIDSKPIGGQGHFSVFSFYATKNITGGEGGIVLTDYPKYQIYLSSIRNNGKFYVNNRQIYGTNRRISDIHSALALSQLDRLDWITEVRNEQADYYKHNVMAVNSQLPSLEPNDTHAFHHYVIYTGFSRFDRDYIKNMLAKEDIYCGVYYDLLFGDAEDCKEALLLAHNSLTLPIGPNLKSEDLKVIAEKVNKFL